MKFRHQNVLFVSLYRNKNVTPLIYVCRNIYLNLQSKHIEYEYAKQQLSYPRCR